MLKSKFRPFILCLGAASVFWLLDALSKDGYSTEVSYPIQFQYDQEAFIPLKPLPQEIIVSLSSTGWGLLKNNLWVGIEPLVYSIGNPLKINQLNSSSLAKELSSQLVGSRVNYVVSDSLELSFDRKLKKTIKLKVDSLAIDLARGFVVSSPINILPNTITIEGPESSLKNYQDLIILPISAKRLGTNFDEKVQIDYPKNPLVKSSAERALVSFEVAELQDK